MAWRRRLFGVLLLVSGLAGGGCAGDSGARVPGPTPQPSRLVAEKYSQGPAWPATNDPLQKATPRLLREDGDVPPAGPAPQVAQAPPSAAPSPTPAAPRPAGTARLSVCAWVNNKPIFDE